MVGGSCQEGKESVERRAASVEKARRRGEHSLAPDPPNARRSPLDAPRSTLPARRSPLDAHNSPIHRQYVAAIATSSA
jgi:hypothetical protein